MPILQIEARLQSAHLRHQYGIFGSKSQTSFSRNATRAGSEEGRLFLQASMVLVDYRKAFDMVDHKLLLRKLELYGIVNCELAWCHSYLLDRKQVVRVNGSESSEALMLHGVPQGSILGPLFFILFINDLPLYTSAQLALYADDTTVTAFEDVKNLATLSLSLNKSVSEIQLWVSANNVVVGL